MFAFAFVVARVPVFVLLSLQAIILPALAQAVANHDRPGLRRGIRQALLIVAALGLVALLVTAPVCRLLLGVLFSDADALPVALLALLAVGAVLAMVVQVLQPALIAFAGHRLVAVAWAAGTAAFAISFTLPLAAVQAATLAQVAGGAVTAAVMATALLRYLRTQPGSAS
jgi:O-antigen/teichoic acid export membrane protein